MDGLKQWALCLIISAAAVTLVTVITPTGSSEKTVRAVAGIFVISAIFTPIADISLDFSAISAAAEYDGEADTQLSEALLDMCRAEAEKAILSAAEGQGATVKEICIDADINADGCIIIHSITVKVSSGDGAKIHGLSAAFTNAVGVPVEVNPE